jgi:hypothetical protein
LDDFGALCPFAQDCWEWVPAALVVADLGADLVFEAPGDPAQAVASVVAGVQHSLGKQVTDVGDGGVGE